MVAIRHGCLSREFLGDITEILEGIKVWSLERTNAYRKLSFIFFSCVSWRKYERSIFPKTLLKTLNLKD